MFRSASGGLNAELHRCDFARFFYAKRAERWIRRTDCVEEISMANNQRCWLASFGNRVSVTSDSVSENGSSERSEP